MSRPAKAVRTGLFAILAVMTLGLAACVDDFHHRPDGQSGPPPPPPPPGATP